MPKICNLRLQHKLSTHSIINEFPMIPSEHDKIELEHCFMKKNNEKKSHTCKTCNEKIKDKIYFICQDCQINVHDKCAALTEKNCCPKSTNDEASSTVDDLDSPTKTNNNTSTLLPLDETGESANGDLKTLRNRIYDRRKPNLIGVQRMSQRIRKTAGFFWQGHMAYSTSDNEQIVTHYWQLDSQKILVYENNQLNNKLFEIMLSSIQRAILLDVSHSIQFKDFKKPKSKCLFCLKTVNLVYNCGIDPQNPYCTENQLARNFYNIFKMVHLPYSKGIC